MKILINKSSIDVTDYISFTEPDNLIIIIDHMDLININFKND